MQHEGKAKTMGIEIIMPRLDEIADMLKEIN
jgi:hypothetical protein